MNELNRSLAPAVANGGPECNTSSNAWFTEIAARRFARRDVVKTSLAATITTVLTVPALAGADDNESSVRAYADQNQRPRIDPGYAAVAAFNLGLEDQVVVPAGYSVKTLIPEGTPIAAPYPPYIPEDLNTGTDREQQAGAHHDGMHFFPLQRGRRGSEHGLLCVNHENIDQAFLHPNGATRGSDGSRPVEDEVRKELASHGVSVVEIAKLADGDWKPLRSRLNRRITVSTPMEFTGPARGSNLLKTKYSPKGTRIRGTLNNCANGYTPWGTYLTCEENWAGYFYNTATTARPREHTRYGVPSAAGGNYGWGTRSEDQYARFNATPTTPEFLDAQAAQKDYRNEPNGFGWVVEIDPFDPRSTPKKRTALGRLAHEGAWLAPAVIGKPIVVYTGDDSRGEYIYKFVSSRAYRSRQASGDAYLDDGTLYVARFNDDGSGQWIALTFGENGLTPANGFADQADVLVNARSAADTVLATKMDRPEWAVVDERSGYVYVTLTNNSNRGTAQPVNPANPRAGNVDGHIIRWREQHGHYWETEFSWDIFVLGGPSLPTVQSLGAVAPYQGNEIYAAQVFPFTQQQAFLDDGATFNGPDGLWVDAHTGLVWIQTDGYANAARGFGNQHMLAANPDTGVVKRFLVGPLGCELTGITATPDRRTLFVNIQHPDGHWPNINGESRPRSATLVITKDDGGVIGS